MAEKAYFTTLTIIAVLLFTGCLFPDTCFPANPGGQQAPAFQGRPVLEVLQKYTKQGINLIYSTDYIPATMLVVNEPVSREPLQVIEEILYPHGLKLKNVDGRYLVVKSNNDTDGIQKPTLLVIIRNHATLPSADDLLITADPEITRLETLGPGLYELFPAKAGEYEIDVQLPGYGTSRSVVNLEGNETQSLVINLRPGPPEIETITVSASRYVLRSDTRFIIEQTAIQALPHSSEDPIRAVQRLPGIASSGFSSRSYFRGGLLNESSIYLNGAKLLEPFHIRDFHSIFSTIDARTISSIEVYTGGLPLEYGDDMSGITMLESKIPENALHTELGLSFFYTSLLNSGSTRESRYDWLVSARRSNLNLVLDPEYGDPEYFDVFASLGFNPSDNTRISLNGLFTDDAITIFTESNPDELEKSVSHTNGKSAWLRMENNRGSRLSADTTVSSSFFSNKRTATVRDIFEMVADVHDYREIRINALRHSMRFESPNGHLLRWGLEFSHQSAVYSYDGRAEYFGVAKIYPGIKNPVAYQINTNPNGNTYAAFLSDRFKLNDHFSFELGLRWDKQTYTEPNYASQLSPRGSMRYSFGQHKNLRLSIGRFYQSQAIDELQVEDDIDHFFAPQYSDQIVAGYEWMTPAGYKFRVEAYHKKYNRLSPRFENLYDPKQMAPEFQPDRVRLDPASARVRGVEFSVEYGLNENFSWWASYALSRATDSIDGRSELRSWDQMHALQLGLGWERGAWETGFTTRIHTGWPTTGLEISYPDDSVYPVLAPGPRNAQRYGTFANLDFRISRQFDVRIGQLTGFLEVTNTTNRDNPCCTDNGIEAGANGEINIIQQTEYWFPIIPSIGVLWEF
ncbi:MAG: TonB-dependent receptor [Lysobacterales bacterium]